MSGSRTNRTRRTGRRDAPTTHRAGSKDGTDGRDARLYGPSSTSSGWPPHGPKLSLQKFQEGTDSMGAFLDIFEAIAIAGRWPRDQWPFFQRESLSGAALQLRPR